MRTVAFSEFHTLPFLHKKVNHFAVSKTGDFCVSERSGTLIRVLFGIVFLKAVRLYVNMLNVFQMVIVSYYSDILICWNSLKSSFPLSGGLIVCPHSLTASERFVISCNQRWFTVVHRMRIFQANVWNVYLESYSLVPGCWNRQFNTSVCRSWVDKMCCKSDLRKSLRCRKFRSRNME